MTQHVCMHEKEITLLVDHSKDMSRDLHTLIASIKGNGKPGLMTEMALQKQCANKLHDRVDRISENLEKLGERADICVANDEAIKRLTKIIWWILSPTLATIIVGVIKMAFFGA